MDELVWMRHRESGGVAQMAASAVDGFELLDWERCDEPDEPNPVLAQHEAAPTPVEEPDDAEPEDEDEPASAGPDHEIEE